MVNTIEKLKKTTNQAIDKRVKDVLEKLDKTITTLEETTNRRIDERVKEQNKLDTDIKVTQATFNSALANLRDSTNKRIENSATTVREASEKTFESVRSVVERLSKSNENVLKDLNKRLSDEYLVTKEMLKEELERQRYFTTGDIVKSEEHLKRTVTHDLARQLGWLVN